MLRGLVEDLRDAMIEYQVCIRSEHVSGVSDGRVRLHYSKTSTTRVVSSL